MQLNWFLPPRKKADTAGVSRTIRGVLRLLGPTWLASPLRRIVQAGCFLTFLWLFCYVCWPYTVVPPGPAETAADVNNEVASNAPEMPSGRIFHDWLPEEADPETGNVTLFCEHASATQPSEGMLVDLKDAGVDPPAPLWAFRVIETAPQRLKLVPEGQVPEDVVDRLTTSFGPWSLEELVLDVPTPDVTAAVAATEPEVWPSHYADDLLAKQRLLGAESMLAIDPLVSVAAAVASRSWVWSLWCAGVILLVCLVVPRGFCGYVCPMGTLLDLFDWAIGRRVRRPRATAEAWWVHLKYYLLAGVLAAALFGVLLAGFVAAIPMITRGLAFLVTAPQTGLAVGWHQRAPFGVGQVVSVLLLLVVLGLGIMRPRFWCKYVCPSGALFSVANLLRLTERKVDSSCIECGKCVKVCPFDAIRLDFATRTADCTFCQTCGGACPSGAIRFAGRGAGPECEVVEGDTASSKKGAGTSPPTVVADDGESALGASPLFRHPTPGGERPVRRRGFLAAAIGGVGTAAALRATGARLDAPDADLPVRPPGSAPEKQFLQMCVRCGECLQACPYDAIQPLGFQQGLQGLWTPQLVADWSGCQPSCNNCGQVCPTGAIRALPMEEKRRVRMGLAVVDEQTCLPFAQDEACQLCVDECVAAGYHAIEFRPVGTGVEKNESGEYVDTRLSAPYVVAEKCVGCGICQTRCLVVNKGKGLLTESAIRVEAGEGKEDRV